MHIFGIRQVLSFGPLIQFSRNPFGAWDFPMKLTRRVPLAELGWDETHDLQGLMQLCALWENFPSRGYSLVSAETKAGDEDQRVDLIYVRSDGALMPCELKLGGRERDTAGQLIRYIADLAHKTVNREWVIEAHEKFVGKLNPALHSSYERRLKSVIDGINDSHFRFLPRSGIILDEAFPPQL
ncbi:MAG TPA: hypothetical protein VGM98_09175, partial [Schlesneria sp.]